MKATNTNNIKESIFTVMSKMATKYEAINLSQGFPNFDSDPDLINLVEAAMRNGHNQYAPMAGDFELRTQISLKIELLYKKIFKAETEITITAGATQAIFTAIAATIHKNDEVIIFTPAYDCYEPTIRLFGGISVPIQLRPPGYHVDWAEVEGKITSKTRMIIINSPHNPSGMIFSEKDMLQLEAIAEKHDLLVISDEVYEHIVFDGLQHYSAAKFPKLSQRTFIIASFGKTFHNTGWKLGYCVASEALMKKFQMVHQFNVFCVNHPMQKALATYLKTPENYLNLGAFYQQKRNYFLSLLKDSRFGIIPSSGTYFQLLDYSEISDEGDIAFTERLTKEYKIATIPTSVFNKEGADFKQIRVCFAKTEATLEAAAKILKSI
ncbi:methionine aminotransferase [Ulvibacter antarcticus]|uniref:Methionine aminotransferase n=1 Tax=Ulvibacter antarcticus TaxID=442714 RepID=A0A3L9YZQ8_9FLAO|nr:methionine aminotransferase [Ulvibacter antarcticus]RMA65804.1 methionine aminotransferase [Ulvibacter antarcticus]